MRQIIGIISLCRSFCAVKEKHDESGVRNPETQRNGTLKHLRITQSHTSDHFTRTNTCLNVIRHQIKWIYSIKTHKHTLKIRTFDREVWTNKSMCWRWRHYCVCLCLKWLSSTCWIHWFKHIETLNMMKKRSVTL